MVGESSGVGGDGEDGGGTGDSEGSGDDESSEGGDGSHVDSEDGEREECGGIDLPDEEGRLNVLEKTCH